MATNEIVFKVKVQKDGNLKVIAKDSVEASKGTEKLRDATDKTTKARNRFSKGEKGVGQAGLSSAKSFSKMQQTMVGGGGLVGAYATLAANVFALTAAFGILQRAAAASQLAEGLAYTGAVAGRNLPYIADQLKKITGEAVSTADAMSVVALATSSGFSSSQIGKLGEVAKGASLALGRDMGDALNRLIRGSAKLEPELLDELGIMVRLDDAAQTYATQLGTTVENLTQYQKRQAFVNAVIKEGEAAFSGIANAVQPNAYDQLAAGLQDLLKDFVTLLNKGIAPLVRMFSKSPSALLGGVLLFASTIRSTLLPGLTQGAQRMAAFAQEAQKTAKASLSQITTTGKLPAIYGSLTKKIQEGTASAKDFKDAQASLGASLQKHNSDLVHNKNLQDTTTQKYKDKVHTINEVKVAQASLTNVELSNAKALTAGSKAATINAAANLDLKGVINGVKGSMAAYRLELGLTSATSKAAGFSFANLKVSLMGLGLSFKALGTIILSALPMLAMIPMILGLGKEAWDKWFGDSDTVKEQKEIFESFEQINEAGMQLNKTLLDIELRKAPTQGWDTFSAKLTTAAGVAAQVRDRINDAVGVQMKAKTLALRDAFNNVTEAQKALKDSSKGAGSDMAGVAEAANLSLAIAKLKELKDAYNQLDPKTLLQGLKEAEMIIIATGNQDGALKHTQEQIRLMTILAAKGTATAEEIGKIMSLPSSAETTVTLLESMNAGLNSFSEDLAKFSQKVETPFDKMSAGLDEAVAALTQKVTVSTGMGYFTKTSKEAKKLREELEKGETPLSKFVKGFATKADGGDPVVTLNRMNDALKANIKIMQENPSKIKAEQAALKKLNDTRKVSGSITKSAHAMEDEIIRLKDEALKAELKNLETLNLTGKKTAEILEIDAKIAANAADKKLQARKNLEILQGEQGFKKLILAQDQKSVDIAKAKLSRTQDQARAAMIAANAADPRRNRSASLNAADELKLLEDSKKDRETIAVLEFNIAVQRTDMEYDLLKMKAKLLKKQGEGDAEFQASITAYEAQLETMGLAALENLGEGLIETLRKINDLTKPKAAVRAEVLGATGTSAYDVNRNQQTAAGEGGDITGALGGDKATLTDKLAVMKATIAPIEEALRKLGPDGELVAAVSSSSINIATSWTTAFDEIEGKVNTMSEKAAIANAVANTIAQTAQIMQAASAARIAGIDKEIAAEKKRDGKSKESLAKIKSLEKKKEAMARKAFEQNKKMQMAQIVASTAAGVMGILGNESIKVGSLAFILAATVAAMGAAQLAIVAGTSYQGGGSAGGASAAGPTSVSVGKRGNSSDMGKSQSARGELAYFRGEQGTGGAENFRSAFYGKKHRAAGGNTGYVVGEQGPELFMPDRPGTIVPADDTAGAGGATNVTFSINAIDASGVEDVLAQQQGNIIGMLRQAANSYGEEFMEDLDESTYTTPAARRA